MPPDGGHWPDGRESMVRDLLNPRAYPHRAEQPEHIETHVSDLFLAGDFAYKVKKPVDFGFCDFTSLDLRRKYTGLELELNRRFSPAVYISVEEVTWEAGSGYRITSPAPGERDRPAAGAPGPRLVEYALKMQRLPAARSLETLCKTGEIEEGQVRQIARRIAEVHESSDAAPPGSQFGSARTVTEIVLGNLDKAQEYASEYIRPGTLSDLRAYSDAVLDLRQDWFERRRREGRIKDCHGDLHAGNIFLAPHVQIIDCIEFSDQLRIIDTAADIAFLAMDLRRLGRPDLAGSFLEEYSKATSDGGAGPLLPFYMAYRASVRAMASGLQRQGKPSSEYAALGQTIMASERPQLLVVMAGTTGSGKSTVAGVLVEQWGLEHLQTDVIRKRLAGLDVLARTEGAARGALYSPEMSKRTYREMERRAAEGLAAGRSLIMDGTFLKRDFRKDAVRIGRAAGAFTVIVECTLSREEQVRRLAARWESGSSVSDGREDVFLKQLGSWQPVMDGEADAVVRVSTAVEREDLALSVLRDMWHAVIKHTPSQGAVVRHRRPG